MRMDRILPASQAPSPGPSLHDRPSPRLTALLCHPLLSLAAIGSLALGIGANTAIFTVLNGSVLRPCRIAIPAT